MMAINYCLVKPSSESKAKILKFVDMLWNQVGEQVLKMKSGERLRPAFVFAYEDSAQVMWLSLTEQTKLQVMAAIRAEAAKVANVEKLVFGALCMPSLVTELTPSAKEGMHHEKIVMHIETPHAEWLMASGVSPKWVDNTRTSPTPGVPAAAVTTTCVADWLWIAAAAPHSVTFVTSPPSPRWLPLITTSNPPVSMPDDGSTQSMEPAGL